MKLVLIAVPRLDQYNKRSMPLRVGTLNLAHGFRPRGVAAAMDLLEALEPVVDAVLLQEVDVPDDVARSLGDRLVYEPLRPPRHRAWGTAIWTPHLVLRALPGSHCHPGACAVAEADTAIGRFTFISLYGLLESLLGDQYSITTLHRLLSDLTGYLDDPVRRGRIVLGGDLNANVLWDDRQRAPTHALLFDRIEAFGLRCLNPGYRDRAGQTPTWFPAQHRLITQLDYLFASRELTHDEGTQEVRYDETVAALTDHALVLGTVGDQGTRAG